MTSHPLHVSRRALVGSARRATITPYMRTGEGWQDVLWDIYTHLGPVHYGIAFKRNSASRVAYFPAQDTEEGEEPEPIEDGPVVEAFERLGEVSQIVAELVTQVNVPGEGYLVGRERLKETWEVWSTIEVNKARKDEEYDLRDDDYLLRIWRPHPRSRFEADSPLRSVQAQCEQLLLLNEQIGATAQSRLPAGLLLMPEEMSFGTTSDEWPDTGANIDGDAFQAELIEMMSSAIQNTNSAARVAPAVVRASAEYLKEVRLLDFSRSMDETFASMREELLRQIAAGLDLPPEIILGYGDLNHWTGWAVDESAAKLHVDPDVLFILQALTDGYLRPMLIEGGMSEEQAETYRIWRNLSDLTARPLGMDHAIKLNEMGVISDEYLRDLANVPEDAAGEEPEPEPIPEFPASPENVVPGPPMVASAGLKLDRLADIDSVLVGKVIEASEAAFHRALERAGAKVRSKASKDRQMSAAIQPIDNAEVTRFLGQARLEQFQMTADQLVPADTFDPLAKRLRKLFSEAEVQRMLELGFIEAQPIPEEDRLTAIEVFITALIGLAVARLFTTTPAPDPAETGELSDSILTGGLAYDLLSAAGGAGVTVFDAPRGAETPRGYALGAQTLESLRDNGYTVTSQTWKYGYPANQFEPHRALNGTVIENLEAPVLRVSPAYAWLGVSHYFPGDHKGCLCQLVPTVE